MLLLAANKDLTVTGDSSKLIKYLQPLQMNYIKHRSASYSTSIHMFMNSNKEEVIKSVVEKLIYIHAHIYIYIKVLID